MQTSIRKKAALLFLIYLATSPAWADRVFVDSNDRRDFYIEPETIETNGYMREVWTLQNYKVLPKNYVFKSARGKLKFDCKNERFRGVSVISYSGSMATGRVTNFDSPAKSDGWVKIERDGDTAEKLMRMVCGY